MEPATTTLPFIVLTVLAGNDPTGLNSLQQSLAPHLSVLAALWGALWLTTAVWALAFLWRNRDADAKV